MRKYYYLYILVMIAAGLVFQPSPADASVYDETKMKSAQFSYEDFYQKISSYEGESGITFISYSPAWGTAEKLKEVEAELLKNKHGEELSLIEKVIIYPDYPAGKDTLGQYKAEYQFIGSEIDLTPGRTINIYGGDDYTTVESIATTLSHEYGHHFTFYYLIEEENLAPENWLDSEYASARNLTSTPAHADSTGEYEWLVQEIFAEDYVQLFGSDNALRNHAQMNASIATPFDNPVVQQYWQDQLPSEEYKVSEPLPFYLINYDNYKYDPAFYNLQFYLPDVQNKRTYVIGRDSKGLYAPAQLDTIENEISLESWYYADKLTPEQAWLFDSVGYNDVQFHAVQYTETGFNKGSQTLKISYNQIDNSITPQNTLNAVSRLSLTEKKQLLREVAIKYGIPPEILKAIAFIETGMQQFDENGKPIITADGGIGMMQVTLSEEEMTAKKIDRSLLENDIRYNVEVGAQILKEKWDWNFLPKINDQNPNSIENWYFAVMAYNGLSKRNDPNTEQQEKPYQERVFDAIRNYSFVDVKAIPPFEISYPDPEKPELMSFPVGQYDWPEAVTTSTQNYEIGDTVYTYNSQASYSNIRDAVDGEIKAQVLHYTPLVITSGPLEREANPNNQFVMYKVEGNGIEGYVASSNVTKAGVKVFSDIDRNEVAAAVAYLNMNDVINGYEDDTYRPNQPLLRRHAAKLLVKELGLELPEDYIPQKKDMEPGDLGYEEMIIVEAYGLMGQGSDLRPNEFLTRSQMASILVRAYKNIYQPASTTTVFADIDTEFWNYENINILAYNNITVVEAFRPQENVTRSQFALFLKRTLDLKGIVQE